MNKQWMEEKAKSLGIYKNTKRNQLDRPINWSDINDRVSLEVLRFNIKSNIEEMNRLLVSYNEMVDKMFNKK